MTESPTRAKYLSSKSTIKGLITFILFRYGKLTAKQIQSRLGLKKQTTYNYLKELQNDDRIGVEYSKVESRPNLSVAYYFIKKPTPPPPDDISLSEHHKRTFSVEQIKNSLNNNIAALLELRVAFDRMPLFVSCHAGRQVSRYRTECKAPAPKREY